MTAEPEVAEPEEAPAAPALDAEPEPEAVPAAETSEPAEDAS